MIVANITESSYGDPPSIRFSKPNTWRTDRRQIFLSNFDQCRIKMSSRQLRKLRQQQELDRQETPQDDVSDDEPIAKPRANLFAGFASLGDEDEAEDEDPEDEPESLAEVSGPPLAAADKKKSKKKKKKKKNTRKEETETAVPELEVDEIDRALEELKLSKSAAGSDRQTSETTHNYERELANLLSINMTHLKVINEMRSLFGRDIIQSANTDSDPQANQPRRNMRQVQQAATLEQFLKGRPGESISDVLLRGNPFVQGKEHWPKASAGGLTMEKVDDLDDGTTEYKFTHDATYAAMERLFFALVQRHDPMMLVQFLYRHPYHVSSLIQVSKVAKQDQNSALAGDLCERALFTFGRVTLSSFRNKLKEGRARLSFRRPENRQFWLAAYNYLKSLVMKGTYRTALEWAKLFLALAPEDPYGILNLIPLLAIRSRESKWFSDLVNHGLFSSIMALNVPNREYIRQTVALAKLQLKDVDGAREVIEQGIGRLPWLYCSLFSALNIDVPKSLWAIQPLNPTDQLYTALFIHQFKDLYNNTDATSLLKDVASSVPRPTDFETLPESDEVRQPIARFVYLDNTPSIMALVPHTLLHVTPNFDFDPIPPPAEENDFSNEEQHLPWRNQGPETEGRMRDFIDALQELGNPGAELAPWDANGDDSADEGGHEEELRDQVEAINALLRQGADGAQNVPATFLERLTELFRGGPRPPPTYENPDADYENEAFPEESMPGQWPDDDSGDDDEMPALHPVVEDPERRGANGQGQANPRP